MASMVKAYKASINGTQFMFGVEILHNVKHALELDKANGNIIIKLKCYSHLLIARLILPCNIK